VRIRPLLGLAIPLACAALFIRLGVWQLSRHRERAAFNAVVAARLGEPPTDLQGVPTGDSASVRGRRVRVTGRFRYDLEQVAAGRVSEGSPGIHLLTPLERPGSDSLLVVIRGWVYSPDAAAVDRTRWRERDTVSIEGYLIPIPADSGAATAAAGRSMRRVTLEGLRARIGAPILAAQLVMTSDSLRRTDSVPRRLPPPAIDPGPHWSYMWQWFAFAAVAIVGGVALVRRMNRRTPSGTGASRRD
jgi:surfeit locus 1 family protein